MFSVNDDIITVGCFIYVSMICSRFPWRGFAEQLKNFSEALVDLWPLREQAKGISLKEHLFSQLKMLERPIVFYCHLAFIHLKCKIQRCSATHQFGLEIPRHFPRIKVLCTASNVNSRSLIRKCSTIYMYKFTFSWEEPI